MWLSVVEGAICFNFLERIKNMSKIQKAVSEIKSIEELANEDRWVNQVHPLVKLCVTILYIGTVVSFSKYNPVSYTHLTLPTILLV